MNVRKKILNRLKSLSDIEGVTVEVSAEEKSLTILFRTEKSLDFYFKWVDGSHYVGYFEDVRGKKSQAVVSLWTPMDAIHFSAAYSLLIKLRAGRLNPLD